MPGNYTVAWDGTGRSARPLSSGIHMARLRMGENAQTMPVVMIKQSTGHSWLRAMHVVLRSP